MGGSWGEGNGKHEQPIVMCWHLYFSWSIAFRKESGSRNNSPPERRINDIYFAVRYELWFVCTLGWRPDPVDAADYDRERNLRLDAAYFYEGTVERRAIRGRGTEASAPLIWRGSKVPRPASGSYTHQIKGPGGVLSAAERRVPVIAGFHKATAARMLGCIRVCPSSARVCSVVGRAIVKPWLCSSCAAEEFKRALARCLPADKAAAVLFPVRCACACTAPALVHSTTLPGPV